MSYNNRMIAYGIVAHGGAGSPKDLSDGVRAAAETAFHLLEKGNKALDAVVEAVKILEDDGRYNAGVGSHLRLDGKTIEMDAAIMDSGGALGTVMAIRGIRNPVLIARAVSGTPHVALAGRGAEAFARKLGFPRCYHVSPQSLANFEQIRGLIEKGKIEKMSPRWKGLVATKLSTDTVGAVAVDRNGVFAVATSTGGASPMLVGRVGDTPLIGCGFYAGPVCTVAVTGLGEEIVKRMTARYVYDYVEKGGTAQEACQTAVHLFPSDVPVGIISISRIDCGIAANRDMAVWTFEKRI